MIDGYTLFLNKFGKIYPETYIKIIEFPDEIITGWINGIRENRKMLSLEDHTRVKAYFDELVAIHEKTNIFRT